MNSSSRSQQATQRPMSHQMARRFTTRPMTSEYREKFAEVPSCHASMSNKPLSPYDPNARRSRCVMPDAKVHWKNASTIVFDNGMHFQHKTRCDSEHAQRA